MRDYNDLVDGAVSVLEHWYRGSLDECHKAGKPALNPREYIGYDSGFFWIGSLAAVSIRRRMLNASL